MSLATAAGKPPLRVVRDRTTSIPSPLTSFIGREKALADVTAVMASHRLVTLTGPGGSGKTRLSIEAARAAAHAFDDGVTWVELAAVTDASLLPQTLAAAFAIRHQQGRGPVEAVIEHLASRRVLLVLDNCEHLIQAVAEMAASLLRETPGVHVLATSRERLAVPGERVWPVPPLGLPRRRSRELDELLSSDSVVAWGARPW